MKLIDVVVAAEGRVCGGESFQWNCWGNNAQFMEFADVAGSEVCNIVFDTKTFDVYDLALYVPNTDQCFKWFNPEFKDAHTNECKVRNVDPMTAWDDVKFVEVTDANLIIQYLKDVVATLYDELPLTELT